jgi:hypothetical protein
VVEPFGGLRLHQAMKPTHVEYWPAYLQSVFAAIGKSLGERRLTPAVVATVPCERGRIIAGHEVGIQHIQGRRGGARSAYVVTILGPQINACWKLRPFEIEQLARSLARPLRQQAGARNEELGAEVW